MESESDEYSGLSDEESSEVSEGSLSEEGQSWDELEKQALEEDRKMGERRPPAGRNARAPPAKGGARRR